jgi:hypothetical protein
MTSDTPPSPLRGQLAGLYVSGVGVVEDGDNGAII